MRLKRSIICLKYVELRLRWTFNRTIVKSRENNTSIDFFFAGLRLPGSQQRVRLLWVKVSECERRGALVKPEEPYRTADRWRRGTFKIRPEG